ncbi:hypothetical protein [Cupriavidus sp. L7L]|uniref:hypothetical protein n=1 Tax=Cupriavidus sp. L7L TaxID=2546443 RepID=UPI00105511D7|nr:hypothetical protein [Cupriavidus sp. L7L]TDF62054.1 hypothetical protein E1J61_31640 [Cupriavidus sp. L7L]
MTKIAMRAATSAAQALRANSLPFTPESTAQLVVAALVGSGVSSYEEAKSIDLPFVVDENTKHGRPWARRLREDVVLQRAETAIMRACERTGISPPSSVELEIQKVRVGSHVQEHIEQHRLFLYTQKLLFSPKYADVGRKILAETSHPNLGPATASGAIASGLAPELPSRTLKKHLMFLRHETARVVSGHLENVAEWIASTRPWVLEFPPPNLVAGEFCRSDEYNDIPYGRSCHLGFGFILVEHQTMKVRGKAEPLSVVVTPTLHHHVRRGADSGPWRAELQKHVVRPASWSKSYEHLQEVLRDKKYTAAQLDACRVCGEIFSDARDDLRRQCTCA